MRGKPLENQAQWREHRLIIITSTSHGLVDGMTEIGLFREDGGTSVVSRGGCSTQRHTGYYDCSSKVDGTIMSIQWSFHPMFVRPGFV